MRRSDEPFCAVCTRVITRCLSVHLDAFVPSAGGAQEGAPALEFDPIATQVGDTPVVTFRCYVSEPLSSDDRYCLVLNPWFDERLFVDRDDIVASMPGIKRADAWSIVWVWRYAWVQRQDGEWTTAEDAAVAVGVKEAGTTAGGGVSPPPGRHPR